MDVWCTNTSCPESWAMKPTPLLLSNHLTLPLAIASLLRRRAHTECRRTAHWVMCLAVFGISLMHTPRLRRENKDSLCPSQAFVEQRSIGLLADGGRV